MPLPARTRAPRVAARRFAAHRLVVALATGGLLLGAAGCASTSTPSGAGTLGAVTSTPSTGTAPTAQATATPTPAVTPTHTPTPPPPVVAALTCGQLKSAEVGSTTVSYNGYHDSIPLGGLGLWSGEDGNTVTLHPQCGIGDLDGDGAKDAVGVVSLTSSGTGDFYTLVVWHNNHGHPVCVAVADIDDRTPVKSISISAQKATVVYYTRTSDAPMIELNIRRTAIYALSGSHFTEISHTDESGEFTP